ncbi:craniofacial development protein 2 [Caerostris extrusa]|uniref:Craniofacial development protein 2 n=1 Tax=Caerostris extrusa TaxID=172846 RepID=A0AAV4PK69_CAEEX|nr:craniofacial development protein 2 [Caerostris extrusa]
MGVILKNLLEKNDNFKDACKIMNQQTPLDSIFVLRLLFQKNAEKQNKPFHVAFLDLKPLYFGIQHPKLFRELEKCGIHKALIGIVKHLYSLNTFRLVTHNKLSEKFTLCKGLISQCSLTPTLFKMYIRETMKIWSEEKPSKWC